MESILLIASGGALGALCRWLTGSVMAGAVPGWPAATLAVNVAGSFLIGLTASAIGAGRLGASPWSPLVVQGFCGALTTFSTFSLEAFRLFDGGTPCRAWAYVLLSMVLCLGAAACGLAVFTGA